MSDHLRDLPARLTTPEVCVLGRISVRTFKRRRRTGKFLVQPIDRNADGYIFPRDLTLRALGLITDETAPQNQPEKARVSVDAIRARRDAAVRGRPPKSGRDVESAVRGAGEAPALRLVVDSSASG